MNEKFSSNGRRGEGWNESVFASGRFECAAKVWTCDRHNKVSIPQCLFLRSGNEGEMRLNETRVSWARNENGEHQSILRGGHSEQREEHFPRCAQGGNRAQNEHASSGYDGESTWKRWKIDWKSVLNVWYSTYNNSFPFLNHFEFVWSLY